MTQPGVLALDALIGAGAELVKHASQLRLHRGATRLPRDEAHLTDRRVRPQAAYADRGAASVHHDPDSTVQDEMHGVGRIPLAYDNFVRLNLNSFAMLDQLVSILRKPSASVSHSPRVPASLSCVWCALIIAFSHDSRAASRLF